MTSADSEEFAALLAGLAEIFGETLSKAKVLGYFDALADLTLDEARAAIRATARTCRFFPKPAELIEAVRGTADDHVERAWVRWLDATASGAYERASSSPTIRLWRRRCA